MGANAVYNIPYFAKYPARIHLVLHVGPFRFCHDYIIIQILFIIIISCKINVKPLYAQKAPLASAALTDIEYFATLSL